VSRNKQKNIKGMNHQVIYSNYGFVCVQFQPIIVILVTRVIGILYINQAKFFLECNKKGEEKSGKLRTPNSLYSGLSWFTIIIGKFNFHDSILTFVSIANNSIFLHKGS